MLYLKAHNWVALNTAIAALAFLAGLGVGVDVPLPNTLNLTLPLSTFMPVLTAILSAVATTTPDPIQKVMAARHTLPWDLSMVFVSLLTAGVLFLSARAWVVDAYFSSYLRNYIGMLGLALISVVVARRAGAWLLPCAFFFTAVLTGVNEMQEAQVWAWALAHGTDERSWLIAIALAAAGLTVWIFAHLWVRTGRALPALTKVQ